MIGSVRRGEEHEATAMEEEKNRELLVWGGSSDGEVKAEVGATGRVQGEVFGENRRVGVGRRLRYEGARDGAIGVFDDLQERVWDARVRTHCEETER
jgi:hypothetical protein